MERYTDVASNNLGTVVPGRGASELPTRCQDPQPPVERMTASTSTARRITCRASNLDVSFAPIPMANENLAGRSIAGYRLLERVGEGGTAEVYRADHPGRGACAFKVLRERLRGDPTVVKRFLRDGRRGTPPPS